MSEYIGSLIAVISKTTNIKFVGTLHQIDSSSLTVTLENVKAYGTEGRAGDPSKEIPPSDQVFEHIVFPGAEVADLKIISQAPKDAQPPQGSQPSQNASQYEQPQYQQPAQYQPPYNQPPPPQHGYNQQWGPPPPQNYPPYGQYPPQQNQFGPPGGPQGFQGPPGGGPNFGPPPGWQQHGFPQPPPPNGAGYPPQPRQGQPPAQQKQGEEPTPQQTPAQAPSAPSATQSSDLSGTSILNASTDPRAPPLPKDSKPEPQVPTEPRGARPQGPAGNPRVAVPSIAPRSGAPTAPRAAPQTQPSAPKSAQNATEAAAAAVAAAMAKLGPVAGKPNGKPAGQSSSTDVDAIAHRIGEMSTGEFRGRGGHRGAANRGARGARRGGGPRQPVEVPTTDFDFESSNAKFNKQDLVKQAIATGSPAGTPTDEPTAAESGPVEAPTAAEEEVVIPGAKKYNKSSFFDDLSSELKDRQVAQDDGKRIGGPDFRSEERRRNMETFGEASPFRGRGRGRGYGGRGRGGGGGGYRRQQQQEPTF